MDCGWGGSEHHSLFLCRCFSTLEVYIITHLLYFFLHTNNGTNNDTDTSHVNRHAHNVHRHVSFSHTDRHIS